jgi:hypothetical protein
MNPNSNQPGFELPAPQVGAGNEYANDTNEIPTPVGAEGAANNTPTMSSVSSMGSTTDTPVVPAQANPAAIPVGSPVIADDADLIEKEWVQKAKQIVAETKNDPHKQNEEISRFKADYLKKRYNKDIKIEES